MAAPSAARRVIDMDQVYPSIVTTAKKHDGKHVTTSSWKAAHPCSDFCVLTTKRTTASALSMKSGVHPIAEMITGGKESMTAKFTVYLPCVIRTSHVLFVSASYAFVLPAERRADAMLLVRVSKMSLSTPFGKQRYLESGLSLPHVWLLVKSPNTMDGKVFLSPIANAAEASCRRWRFSPSDQSRQAAAVLRPARFGAPSVPLPALPFFSR